MIQESAIRRKWTKIRKMMKMLHNFFHSLSPELQQTILSFLSGTADAMACFKRDGPFSRLQYLCWGFPDKQNPTILGLFGLRGQPWWDHVSDTDAYSRRAYSSSSAAEEDGVAKKHSKPILSIRDICNLLESNIEVISEEFEHLRSSAAVIQERLKTSVDSKGEWKAFYLMDEGIWSNSSSITCPITHSLLQQLPVCECSFGYVYFSVLSPHTYIDPHCGATNAKLRLQLPLINKAATAVFSDCSVTVNGEVRSYVPGKAIVFDDSFTHSVRNDGDSERVVLLIDLWHPDLPATSIAQISSGFSVYQAISMFDEGHFHKFPVEPSSRERNMTMSASPYDYLFKFLLVGCCGAGKSSFVLRWAEDTFTDGYMSTIGVDFKIRCQDVRNSVVKVQ
eukprot:gene41592-55138_t